MLRAISGHGPPETIGNGRHEGARLAAAPWLDLLDATEAERALVERATGLVLPSAEDVAEIESSSRLNDRDGVLTLTTPMIVRRPEQTGVHMAPLGFVVTRERLVTLRYGPSPVIDAFAGQWQAGASGAADAFVGLLEQLADRLADILEHIAGDLEAISARIFSAGAGESSAKRRDAALRRTLTEVGRIGEGIGHLRDALLGLSRIARYVREIGQDRLRPAEVARLATVAQDLASLNDYDAQLNGKVQFLLDATLGFINIEQNNGIRILTVVSVVGIPPTLIASIYGMNFKIIPELQWTYGYPYALGLMVASVAVPMVWFRKKGWV